MIASMNYAIQTSPPPQGDDARRSLATQHLDLAQYFGGQNDVDLARDHLQSAIDLKRLRRPQPRPVHRHDQAAHRVQRGPQRDPDPDRQHGPGDPGGTRPEGRDGTTGRRGRDGDRAALRRGPGRDEPRPGQADPARPLLPGRPARQGPRPLDRRELRRPGPFRRPRDRRPPPGPRFPPYRQLPERDLDPGRRKPSPSSRPSAPSRPPPPPGPSSKATRCRPPGHSSNSPDEVTKQALWEFDLALACLESGQPTDVTAAHFTNALTLAPGLTIRPVIAYYLEKLGKPVPPIKPEPAKPPETKPATP